jgi:hypothetical protein
MEKLSSFKILQSAGSTMLVLDPKKDRPKLALKAGSEGNNREKNTILLKKDESLSLSWKEAHQERMPLRI